MNRFLSRRLLASAAQAPLITVRSEGKTRIITINRPEKFFYASMRNAVNQETAAALMQAFREFDADSSVSVAVLAGYGGTFCAGFDLKAVATGNMVAFPPVGKGDGPMGPSRFQTSKPTIAAIDGHAVAGGMELALWCDLRVVERDAIMGIFCRRFGVPLIDGGTIRLQAIVGLGRALDLILTGRAIDSTEALAIGLANRVVEKGQALKQAIELAELIASFPSKCMLADRTSTYYAAYDAKSMQDALDFEFEHGIKVIGTESVAGAQFFAQGHGRKGVVTSSKL